jgi:GT2 family glycosyltransferase
MSRVSVQIVTFNSADDIGTCLESLRGQTWSDFRIRILDNASTDRTLDVLTTTLDADRTDIVRSDTNTGFAAAHNRLARDFPADFVLFLNPDTILDSTFISELVGALELSDEAGSASGKLLRMDGVTIDSTGIVMTRNQRHLDRGAEQPDSGQYDRPERVFGPSGAAAMYRYSCLNDVRVGTMIFDEDFFAYREDADLAWRSQLLGWASLYVPTAVARHRRRVTPQRRSNLSALINRHSVKNRFLLRINNMTAGLYRRDFWRITARDVAVVGYVFAWEWSSIPAIWYILSNRRRLWTKRRDIQSRVRAEDREINAWFQSGS